MLHKLKMTFMFNLNTVRIMVGQSYKQINFLRSEYVTSKLPTGVTLMDFSKLGNNIDMFIYQLSNQDDKFLVSEYRNIIPHSYKGLQFDNFSEYFATLKVALQRQLNDMYKVHAKNLYDLFDDDKYHNMYKSLSIGLLLTPLSSINRNFTTQDYIEFIEEAKLYELFLKTAYSNKWYKMVQALKADIHLDYDNFDICKLYDDVWYMYLTALSDLFNMDANIDAYSRRFLLSMIQIIFDTRDNFELYLTNGPESMTCHVTYNANVGKLHTTMSGNPLYGTYRKHNSKKTHTTYDDDDWLDDIPYIDDIDTEIAEPNIASNFNISTFKRCYSHTVFHTISQILKSQQLNCILLLTNLHCKLLDASSTLDLHLYRFKRLTRHVQVINHKQLHVKHYTKLTKHLTQSCHKHYKWAIINESQHQMFRQFESTFKFATNFTQFDFTKVNSKTINIIETERISRYCMEDYKGSNYQLCQAFYNGCKQYRFWRMLQQSKRQFYLTHFYQTA